PTHRYSPLCSTSLHNNSKTQHSHSVYMFFGFYLICYRTPYLPHLVDHHSHRGACSGLGGLRCQRGTGAPSHLEARCLNSKLVFCSPTGALIGEDRGSSGRPGVLPVLSVRLLNQLKDKLLVCIRQCHNHHIIPSCLGPSTMNMNNQT